MYVLCRGVELEHSPGNTQNITHVNEVDIHIYMCVYVYMYISAYVCIYILRALSPPCCCGYQTSVIPGHEVARLSVLLSLSHASCHLWLTKSQCPERHLLILTTHFSRITKLLHWETRSKYKSPAALLLSLLKLYQQRTTANPAPRPLGISGLVLELGPCCRAGLGLSTPRTDTGYLDGQKGTFLLPVLATHQNQSPKTLPASGLWRAVLGQRLVSAGMLGGTHKTSPKAWTMPATGMGLIVTPRKKTCLARVRLPSRCCHCNWIL